MAFYMIDLDVDERIHVHEKTKLLRLEDGFHSCLTEGPVSVFIDRKHKHLDFVWASVINKNSSGTFFLLSPKLWNLLENIGATGFLLRETSTKLVFEHEPSERDYRQMVITGWGGIAKGIHRVESYRGKHCYSLPDHPTDFFDLAQWDGSDIFDVWPIGIVVTERIANLVKSEKIRGLHLEKIDSISFTPVDEQVGFIGHPLRKFYPDERAREIGEPLGIYWWEEDKREA